MYWDSRREFSAEFYGHGAVRTTDKPEALRASLAAGDVHFIVTEQRDLPSLPADIRERFAPTASFPVMKDTMLLLRDKTFVAPAQ